MSESGAFFISEINDMLFTYGESCIRKMVDRQNINAYITIRLSHLNYGGFGYFCKQMSA